jgi:hypothetical protein
MNFLINFIPSLYELTLTVILELSILDRFIPNNLPRAFWDWNHASIHVEEKILSAVQIWEERCGVKECAASVEEQ